MKKIMTSLVLIFVVFMINSEPCYAQIYKNYRFNFQVNFPDGWQIISEPDGDYIKDKNSDNSDHYAVIGANIDGLVTISVNLIGKGYPFNFDSLSDEEMDKLVLAKRDNIVKYDPHAQIYTIKTSTIADKKAILAVFNAQEQYYLDSIFCYDGKLYTIRCLTIGNQTEKTNQVYLQLINTFDRIY